MRAYLMKRTVFVEEYIRRWSLVRACIDNRENTPLCLLTYISILSLANDMHIRSYRMCVCVYVTFVYNIHVKMNFTWTMIAI